MVDNFQDQKRYVMINFQDQSNSQHMKLSITGAPIIHLVIFIEIIWTRFVLYSTDQLSVKTRPTSEVWLLVLLLSKNRRKKVNENNIHFDIDIVHSR